MSKLSDALKAMDKIEALEAQYMGTIPNKEILDKMVDLDNFAEGHWRLAMAWIKEALPWIEEMRLHVSIDPAHYDHELARLDALIARAKPGEVGNAEN